MNANPHMIQIRKREGVFSSWGKKLDFRSCVTNSLTNTVAGGWLHDGQLAFGIGTGRHRHLTPQPGTGWRSGNPLGDDWLAAILSRFLAQDMSFLVFRYLRANIDAHAS